MKNLLLLLLLHWALADDATNGKIVQSWTDPQVRTKWNAQQVDLAYQFNNCHLNETNVTVLEGATENAKQGVKMQEWKIQERKMHFTGF